MKHSSVFLVAVVILAHSPHSLSQTEGDTILLPIESISAAAALSKAIEYTGFAKEMVTSKSLADTLVGCVVINEDESPYLSPSILGKEVWLVNLENVQIGAMTRNSDPHSSAGSVKDFQVYIDKKTGHLLKVVSKFDGDDPNMLPEPPADSATQSLQRGGEIYHGFPDIPPQIPFVDALLNSAGCAPLQAKEIIAVYVLHSRNGTSPRPVWSITCRGIPPISVTSLSRTVPIKGRNRARCVVDATTGKCLFMTTRPRPVSRSTE